MSRAWLAAVSAQGSALGTAVAEQREQRAVAALRAVLVAGSIRRNQACVFCRRVGAHDPLCWELASELVGVWR